MFLTALPTQMRAVCALTVVSVIATACAQTQLAGEVIDQRYISPLGNFDTGFPLMGPGKGTIDDGHDENNGFVTFIAGTGGLTRIDYSRLPPELAATMDVEGDLPDAAYLAFFNSYTLPMFKDYSAQTQTLHEEFVSEDDSRAYFAIVLISGGSAWIDGMMD
jgi:hypothetical protein